MKYFLFILIGFNSLYSSNYSDLDKFIEEYRIKYDVPGLAVAIVEGDKIVFAKGYGLSNLSKKEKVDEQTVFQLASVSKTFAAAGLGVAVDNMLVGWDQPVFERMSTFTLQEPYSTRYATPRDLLAHRTGLPMFQGDLLGELGYDRKEVLNRIRFIEPAVSFREKALYSNVGFFLAGELLSQVSKESWEDVIQKSLLTPLKMNRTGFAASIKLPNQSLNYAKINNEIKLIQANHSRIFAAAGGVSSCAKDLGNWMIMHLNEGKFEGKEVLKPESIKEIFRPSIVGEVSFAESFPITADSSFAFGMGWDNYQYKDNYIVEKAGALEGVRSVITLIPAKKTGIVILANLNLTLLPELIRAQFLAEHIEPSGSVDPKIFEEQSKEFSKLFNVEEIKNPLPFTHSLEKVEGTYSNELYGDFVLKKEGDKLVLLAGPANYKGSLEHSSNDSFTLSWPFMNSGHQTVTFMWDEQGEASRFFTETLGSFTRKIK